MQRTNKVNLLYYLFSFFLPLVVACVTFVLLRIYPFGPHSILSGDLLGQYISIMDYVRYNLFSSKSLFFSNSVGLGINFFPVLTYYISSPINLFIVFFSRESMPLFFELNIILDIALTGLTTYVFITHSFFINKKKKIKNNIALLGALGFSLSAYLFSYQQCVMWLNSIWIFPIIVLGFERIQNGYSPKLYYFSLLFGIISNYYIGILILIFLFFEGLFWLIYHYNDPSILQRCTRLIFGTLLAILSSAFILIPTFIAQKSVEQSSITFDNLLQKIYPVNEFVKGIIINPNSTNVPILFCGIIMPLLVLLYFFNDKIPEKERLVVGCFLAFLIISTIISVFYMMWHMFTLPNGFPQRESFVISFVIIMIAVKELNFYEEDNLILSLGAGLWILVLVYEVLRHNLSEKFAIINIFFIIVCVLILKYVRRKNVILIGMICLECAISGWAVNKDTRFANYSAFEKVNYAQNQAMDKIQKDHSFYRVGTTSQISTNDPMTYNYNGLSGYLSQQPTEMVNYLAYLGYFQKYSWYRWSQFNNGSTVAIDSLLNLKYVLGANSKINQLTKEIGSFPTMNGQESVNHYELLGKVSDFNLYRNTNVFPPLMQTDTINRFYQNQSMGNIFNNYNRQFSVFNIKNIYGPIYGVNGKKIKSGENTYTSTEIKHSGLVYMYVPRSQLDKMDSIKIKVNNSQFTYSGDNMNGENGILCLGYFGKSSKMRIKISSKNKNTFNILCYQENRQSLEMLRSQLHHSYKSNFHNVHITNGKIEFTSQLSSNKYVTFPFYSQRGWVMYLNGKKYDGITKNFGALLAAKVPAGYNHIKIVYEVPKLRQSIILSSISMLVSFGWLFKFKIKR